MFICKSYVNIPEVKISNLEKSNEEWEKYFGSSETLFPDQPTKIKFKKISDEYMIMVLETNTRYTWTLPSKEFLITLLNESEMFFKSITESLSLTEKQYGFEISKIKELKNNL